MQFFARCPRRQLTALPTRLDLLKSNHGHEQRRRNYRRDHQRQSGRGAGRRQTDLQHLVAANHAEHGNRETRRVEDQGPSRRLHRAARTGRRRSGDGHRVVRPDINRKVATSIARTIGGNGIPYLPAGTPDNTEGTFPVSTDRILYYSRKVWQLRLNYIPLRSVLA